MNYNDTTEFCFPFGQPSFPTSAMTEGSFDGQFSKFDPTFTSPADTALSDIANLPIDLHKDALFANAPGKGDVDFDSVSMLQLLSDYPLAFNSTENNQKLQTNPSAGWSLLDSMDFDNQKQCSDLESAQLGDSGLLKSTILSNSHIDIAALSSSKTSEPTPPFSYVQTPCIPTPSSALIDTPFPGALDSEFGFDESQAPLFPASDGDCQRAFASISYPTNYGCKLSNLGFMSPQSPVKRELNDSTSPSKLSESSSSLTGSSSALLSQSEFLGSVPSLSDSIATVDPFFSFESFETDEKARSLLMDASLKLPQFSTPNLSSNSSSLSLKSTLTEGTKGSTPLAAIKTEKASKAARVMKQKKHREHVCFNCGVTETPLWRRTSDKLNFLCNACGLYNKQYGVMRPLSPRNKGSSKALENLVCANCSSTKTSLWRKDRHGQTVCNACGLYARLHGHNRPIGLKKNKITRRRRGKGPGGEDGMSDEVKSEFPVLSKSVTMAEILSSKGLESPQLTNSVSVSKMPNTDADVSLEHAKISFDSLDNSVIVKKEEEIENKFSVSC
ncbi:Transcription factor [Schizosaccharomyces pombe]